MKRIITFCISVSFFASSFAQYKYPPSKTVDSSDTDFQKATQRIYHDQKHASYLQVKILK